MSTYLYLKCLDHDPPLISEGESGQHLYDLPQIRADIANRGQLVDADLPDYYRDNFRHNTVWFLTQHPRCRIGIVDEYGHEHSAEEEQA